MTRFYEKSLKAFIYKGLRRFYMKLPFFVKRIKIEKKAFFLDKWELRVYNGYMKKRKMSLLCENGKYVFSKSGTKESF